MLDYLAATPHEVVALGENAGHRAVWTHGVREQLRQAGPFIVTDPDVIPDPECPDDAIVHLRDLLDEYPKVPKIGLGLHIDDLPALNTRADEIRDWESQFWERELAPGVFEAGVDTTFALYRAGAGPDEFKAIRTGAPFMARHLPWYDDADSPIPEEIFYRARARTDSTNWHGAPLKPHLSAALARHRRQKRGQVDHPLLDAWAAEPELVDESEFTPWAPLGWSSWNAMSAERDFCDFVGLLAQMLQPRHVIETGIGQGFTTRRLASRLGDGLHVCFENDPEIRAALADLPFFADERHQLREASTPSAEDFAQADLTVLDSEPPDRFTELKGWRTAGHAGSVLVVHDCGNGHPEGTYHDQIRRIVEELEIPGVFLRNPRGAFLGFHPGVTARLSRSTRFRRQTESS
jgi:hypothetical protein